MEKIIAYCGLICTECPAYKAHKNDDEQLRIKTAEEWSKMFKAKLKPKSINCVGCLETEGILFFHCMECKIRVCCQGKTIPNCAYCNDYGCEHITEFFDFVPDAKKVLDDIRANL
jgi:hypothetical protein